MKFYDLNCMLDGNQLGKKEKMFTGNHINGIPSYEIFNISYCLSKDHPVVKHVILHESYCLIVIQSRKHFQ